MRDVRKPDDHRRSGIPVLLSLGAVDSTVNASVSQCHGRTDNRRNSASGCRVRTTTAVAAIALQDAGLGPPRRRTVVACMCRSILFIATGFSK